MKHLDKYCVIVGIALMYTGFFMFISSIFHINNVDESIWFSRLVFSIISFGLSAIIIQLNKIALKK